MNIICAAKWCDSVDILHRYL